MFSKKVMKLIAFVLTLVMSIYLLPLDALAYELNTELADTLQSEEETTGTEPVEYETPAEVVMEIEGSRDEFQKEYLLDNGHRMYVIYPTAVHYDDNGQWQEIDNTLSATTLDGQAVYTNTAGAWDVVLPQSISTGKSIEVSKDGYTLGMSFLGKETVPSASGSMGSISSSGEAALITEQMNTSTAVIENSTVTFSEQDVQLEQVSSDKLGSAITYGNIYDGVDIRYDLISDYLKESIIVNNEPSGEETYGYLISAVNMEMFLQDDNSIYVYAEDAAEDDEPIFYLPAPYMTDNGGGVSFDIEVSLTLSQAGYILTYTPSYEWMSADERVYPVIIDPVVKPDKTKVNISDQTVFSKITRSSSWGMVECGYYSTTGISRTFLKYENIPELTSSDMIIDAEISLYKLQNSTAYAYVNVHKVLDTWSAETITWANKPEFNPVIEDYQYIYSATWYTWDVTDIAKGWYEGENTGMMFKSQDNIESSQINNFKQFCSSDYGGNVMPIMTITYINNNGLENHWDYTAHSAGRAGTGYINNYTGNLVWVNNGLGFSGNRKPVSINHIYNANDKSSNAFGMGYGWRTNYNQTVQQWDKDDTYYVWDDEDGTKHYFEFVSSGTYEDELGTGLVLTTTGSGTTTFCITDKENNKLYFDSYGRLSQISNYQATTSSILITYTDNTNKYISTITDGAGRVYQFAYSSSNLLSSITFKGTGSDPLSTLTYTYSSSGLSKITYPDSKYVTFGYTNNNLLNKVTDVDGYYLSYSYNTTSLTSPNRVTKVQAYDGTTAGGTVNISYGHNQTYFVDHNGNKQIYQFNDWGNTVSVQDGEGRAQFASYATDDPEVDISKANQMVMSSKLQNTVANLVRNSSFESSGYWAKNTANATTGSWGYSTAQKYIGSKSLYITRTANTGDYLIHPTTDSYFTLEPGVTYTLSAYVKTTGMDGTGGGAFLTFAGTGVKSTSIKENSEWTRLEVTYTHPSTSSSTSGIASLGNSSIGTAYFDCVQVEVSSSASRYNLVDNGDFTFAGSSGTAAYGWSKGDACAATEIRTTYSPSAAPQLDSNVYSITGAYSSNKRLYQNIAVSGSAGDVFTVAGWAKGDSAPLISTDRRFGLVVRFYNTDGTQSEILMDFNDDARSDIDWQYAAKRVVAPKNYSSIRVLVVYEHNINVVYFDGIQLFKEEFGHSYVYDENGNVTSVTDLQAQTTTYAYTNNRLTSMTLPSGASQTYTYDTYGNVLTSTSPEGVISTFTYDTYGNNLTVTVGTGTQKVTTSATYTSNGNQLSSITDARGNKTTYDYDTDTGVLNWVQAPGETDATRTNYTYDDLYRTTSVSKDSTSNTYAYTDDLLTQSTSAGGTVYTYNYGLFDQTSNIQVGDRTLISHTYASDQNRYLTKSTYGNDDYITYTYDDLGRTTGIGYEDNASAIQYKYNNDGDLGVVVDNMNSLTTKYYYDMQGRLVGYDETGTNHAVSVLWGYDDLNNLSSQKITVNGTAYTESYAYDDDNRITQSTAGSVVSAYTYDSYSRMTKITNKNSSTAVVTTDIGYLNPSSTTTSGLVSTWKNTHSSTTKTYTYVYDSRDNITSINDGTYTTTYVYDQHDQLTRENNQAVNKTWVYDYDTAGNILSKTEYAYTTGTVGTAIDTIEYKYEDETWHELLTEYDGQEISYDGIGNMTSDGTWAYTWEHGRQLATATDGTTSVSYEYNADGMRLSKTVGSTTIKYYYVGSQLVEMTQGTNTLHFTYDATGASAVTYNGTNYYYLKNAQGDILGIVNTSGSVVVSYIYDAWGNVLSVTGTMASTLGALNPLRYRGYVYDTETGLYYLQSRYFSPAINRWFNTDDTSYLFKDHESVLQYNVYTYCWNNPINVYDPDGHWGLALLTSAGTVAATNIWNPLGWIVLGTVATVLVIVVAVDIYDEASSRDDPDPYSRPGQKKQGRERKNKSRTSKDWKPRSTPKPPKKHTPGRGHRKYK